MERTDSREDLSFGAIAIRLKLASPEQIAEALKIQSQMKKMGVVPKKLGEIMVEKKYLTEDHVRQIFWVQGIKGGHTQIAGYKIVEKIGQGAMGAVYKAIQLSMDRVVALKILPAGLAENKKFIERFFREARAVARLNHPNIVQGIDVGESNGVHYFAMEYLSGFNVGNLLRRGGALEEKRALQIVMQVAEALEHARVNGMVHRDVKPDNIMVTRAGQAKLLDLGLAKLTKQDGTNATDAGSSMGTPNYISPEQAKGLADIDTRSDLYSLGATLYHMVTGQVPFPLESAMEVLVNHVTAIPPSPIEIQPSVSEETDFIVMKMMEKDPAARYQTPADLVLDLKAVLEGGKPAEMEVEEEPPQPAPGPERTPSPPGTPPSRPSRILGGAAGYKYLARRRRFRR